MDYTNFIMAFSRIDVCFALRGWHAQSVPTVFPLAADKCWRIAEAFVVTPRDGCGPTTVHVSALQPTSRGAWCRADRKKR
jgi:hypothetical protein